MTTETLMAEGMASMGKAPSVSVSVPSPVQPEVKAPPFVIPELTPFEKRLANVYRIVAKGLAYLIWRPKFYGFEKIPKDGPVLLICNHVSYLDGFLLQAAFDRPVRFIIDWYIYRVPGVYYFMRLARAIPIAPKRDFVEAALEEVSKGLKAGDAICIFPEGQLTYTGSLGRFRPGIEWMVKRDPIPVYPIALRGLWGSFFSRKYLRSKYRWMPRRWLKSNVRAEVGEPIAPEKVTVNHLQRTVLRMFHQI